MRNKTIFQCVVADFTHVLAQCKGVVRLISVGLIYREGTIWFTKNL